jgi:hypothetical protein
MTFDEWYSKEGFSYQRIERILMQKAWDAASRQYVQRDAELPSAYLVLASGEGGELAATVWIRLADAEQDAHEWRINGKTTEIVPLCQCERSEG